MPEPLQDASNSSDPRGLTALAARFRGDLWNTGDLAIVDEIVAADCLIHARIPLVTDFARGPEAIRQLVLFYHLAFSDIEMTIEQVVAQGNTVVIRWHGRGKHTGDLLEMPPTHRETLTSGIDMLRVENGKVAEGWVSWDTLSLLEQLLAPDDPNGEGSPDRDAGFLSLLGRLQ